MIAIGRWPAGLLGMVALVAAVEGVLAHHELDTRSLEAWDCLATRRAAVREAKAGDVLCFGDSLMKLNLAPSVLAAHGIRAYNLAICGGQAPMSYFVLRRALEAGARPRAIIVDYSPPLMRLGPRHNLDQWPYLASLRDALDLARSAGDGDLFGLVLVGKVLTSARDRHPIRANLAAALAGRPASYRWITPPFLRNWRVNAGAQIMPSNPAFRLHPIDPEAWRLGFYPHWECRGVNATYIRRSLALAEAHRIPVYLLLPPLMPALQEACERSGFAAAQSRFAEVLRRRYPNLVILDGRRSEYDPGVFMDPNHLGHEGARALSRDIAEILERQIRGGSIQADRWVALPRYRPVEGGSPLEHVEASKLALGRPATLAGEVRRR